MALPFGLQQFNEVFKHYNDTTGWTLPILVLAALGAAMLAGNRRWQSESLLITAALWTWTAVFYHLAFFTTLSPAAYLFAAAFLLEAAILIWWSVQTSFVPPSRTESVIAWILFAYALVIYPAIGYATGHFYPYVPTFGAPCPVVIFSFGIFALHARTMPLVVLGVPLLWTVAATFTALNFAIVQDFGMTFAAATVSALVLSSRMHHSKPRYHTL